MTPKLRIGDVCKLTELGRLRNPKTRWTTAIVVSVIGNGRSYRILPAGRKDAVRMHGSYLELGSKRTSPMLGAALERPT